MNDECKRCDDSHQTILRLIADIRDLKLGLKYLLDLDFSNTEAKNSYINLLLKERI